MKNNQKILFVVASHGDEPIGLNAVKELKKLKNISKFDYIIANPQALKKNVRFIDSDLNRIYPGKLKGNNEERIADRILKYVQRKNYDCVVDLHGTISRTGVFAIITKLNKKTLKLALMFGVNKIVIWPESGESCGSLSTFMKCGIEIESGPKDSIAALKKLKNILIEFLDNSGKVMDMKSKLKEKEFYTVIGKIKKPVNGITFRDWEKTKNFYPLFVGQYEGIACYKLKKVNISKLVII